MNKRGDVVVKDICALFLIYILMISVVTSSANISLQDNSTNKSLPEEPQLENSSQQENISLETENTTTPETNSTQFNQTNTTEHKTELIQGRAKVGQNVIWTKRAYTTDQDYVETTYETPAPKKIETKTPKGKQVLIYSEEHYKNVIAQTNITFNLKLENKNTLNLFWKEENKYLDFQAFDSNDDGIIDYIEWEIPHLSNQTFEIFINVLNVQSYPMVGGEWKVDFQTQGTANLTITPVNGTAFNQDLKFLELKCGNTEIDYEYNNGIIFVENYECQETSSETSRVLTPGKHHLEFKFGESTSYAHNSADDFKVQRGYTIFSNGQATTTITAGIDYEAPVGEAFIRLTNTRLTGMGETTTGGGQNADDFTVNINNPSNLPTSIDFTRFGTANDNRIAWEIIEYTGPEGGANEFKIRQEGVQTFTTTDLTSDTSTISGISDDNDIVVFITGQSNPDTGRSDINTGMHTAEWISASDIARFTRGEASSDATKVSYAVVEFTGQNWKIQRKEHNYTASGTTETEIITEVNSLAKTFLHTQHRAGSGMQGLDEQGGQAYLSSTTQLSFQLQSGAGTTGQSTVAWIIENNQTYGTPMNVQHIGGTRATGGTEEDTWTETITTLASTNTTSIMGENAVSAGGGTAFPRGSITLYITSTTAVELKQSDTGQDQGYRFSVVEWPTAPPTDEPNFFNPATNKTILAKNQFARFSIDVNDTSNSVASVNGTINGINYSFTQGTGDSWHYDWQCTTPDPDVSFTYAEAIDDAIPPYTNSTSVTGISLICDPNNPQIDFVTPDTPANDASIGNSFFSINTTTTETNFANITYSIYNSTDLINQTTYFTQTPGHTFSGLTIGDYFYNVTAVDLAGQTNSTSTRTIYIDPNNPQIIYSSDNPPDEKAITGTEIYLNVTVTEPNEANITFNLYDSSNISQKENTFTDNRRSVTWTLLQEGLYYYNVTVVDIFGHSNSTQTRTIILDNTPPTIDYTNPTETNFANKSQNWIYINTTTTETNLANITYTLYNSTDLVNQTTYTTQTNQINFTNLPDETYTYNVTITDKAAQTQTTQTRTINLDTTIPQISFTSPTENNNTNLNQNWIYINTTTTETNLANITFNLYDQTSLINQTTYTNTEQINLTNLESKIYFYNVTATDFAGNTNTTQTNQIGLDTLGPTINIITPQAKAYGYNTSLPLNYTATDNIVGTDQCWWNLDNNPNQSITCGTNTTFDTDEGAHTLYLYSNDTFGNLGTSQVSFSVSTTGPAIELTSPNNNTFYGAISQIQFNYTANDPDSVDTCSLYGSWNGGWHLNQTNFAPATSDNFTIQAPSEGIYIWNTMCNDTVGYDTFALTNNTFTIDITAPAVYYATGTEDDGENKSQTWIYVNTNVVESNFQNITFFLYDSTDLIQQTTFTDSTREINWTGLSDGMHFYNITAYDKVGNNGSSTTRSINLDTQAPEGNLLTPTTDSYTGDSNQNLTANFTDGTGLAEAILFIFNSTGFLIHQSDPVLLGGTISTTIGIVYNFLSDGIFTWFYQVEDTVGNLYNTTNNTLNVDTTLPSIVFTSPTESSGVVLEKDWIYINTSITDPNFQNITFNLYNDEGIIYQNTFSDSTRQINWTLLADDLYFYNVTTYDKSGNSNSTETRNISLDNTLPIVDFTTGTQPNEEVIAGNEIFVNVTVTEPNEANITFKLFDESHTLERENTFTDNRRSLTWTLISEGTHYYNVTVYDVVGHKQTTQTRTIILDNTPPTIDYTNPTETNFANKSQNWIYINASVVENNFENTTFSLYNSTPQ